MATTTFSGPVVSTNGFKTGSTTLTGADFAAVQSLVSGGGLRGVRASVMPKSYFQVATGNANYTYQNVYAVDFDFVAVQIGVFNCDPAATVAGVYAGASASESFGSSPSGAYPMRNGARDDTGWVKFTFGGATTVTLPVATSSTNPSISWSDPVLLSSVARTDVADGPRIIFLRHYIPTGITATFGYSIGCNNRNTLLSSLFSGCAMYCYGQAGDRITIPSTATFASTSDSHPPVAVRFLTAEQCRTFAVFGDSRVEGATSGAADSVSYIERAVLTANAATGAVPFSYYNGGASSQTSSQFLARAQSILPTLRPKYAFMSLESPNDATPWTAAATNAQIWRWMTFFDLCESIGTRPIINTPLPFTASTPTVPVQAEFTRLNNFALAMAASGAAVLLDTRGIHLVPGQWLVSGYQDGTGMHPTTSGAEVLRGLIQTTISGLA